VLVVNSNNESQRKVPRPYSSAEDTALSFAGLGMTVLNT